MQKLALVEVSRLSFDKARHQFLFHEGDVPSPFLITSGWVAIQRTLSDGRRQIYSFGLPGDIIGGFSPFPWARCEAVCLTDVAVVYDIDLAGQDQGASGLGYRSSSGLLQLYYLDHIMRLGQLTAVERMGHFLLEVELRLRRAGLSIGGRFELPITQEALADYLGLSPVHVNRVLQKLRRDNLVEREGHTHIIKDFKRLAEESHFKLSDLPANV